MGSILDNTTASDRARAFGKEQRRRQRRKAKRKILSTTTSPSPSVPRSAIKQHFVTSAAKRRVSFGLPSVAKKVRFSPLPCAASKSPAVEKLRLGPEALADDVMAVDGRGSGEQGCQGLLEPGVGEGCLAARESLLAAEMITNSPEIPLAEQQSTWSVSALHLCRNICSDVMIVCWGVLYFLNSLFYRSVVYYFALTVLLLCIYKFTEDVAVQLYCTQVPKLTPRWVSAWIVDYPPGCSSLYYQLPPFRQHQYTGESLDGMIPLVPSSFELLWRNMDDINVKLSNVTDMVNHLGVKNLASRFDASYRAELKRTACKEAVFWHNQRAHWEATDSIIRNFNAPSSDWCRFWDPKLHDAKAHNTLLRNSLHSALLHIDTYVNVSMDWTSRIPRDSANSFQHEIKDLFNGLAMPKALQASSAVWGILNELMMERLVERQGLLQADKVYLERKLKETATAWNWLKNGRNGLSYVSWEKRIGEIENEAWEILLDLERRLRRYFVKVADL